MLITHQNPFNRSIMVSLLGRPNAGKSSLINHLLGFDLSIVSHKPQTTRNQFHCNFVIDKTEVILLDTPGIHKSSNELNIRMNGQAQMATEGVDLNLILMDMTTPVHLADFEDFLTQFDGKLGKSWLIFTKADLVEVDIAVAEKNFKLLKTKLENLEKFFVISTKDETGIEDLKKALVGASHEGPHLYPDGSVSNKNMRFFAAEYIREQAFSLLKEELPYELAVTIDQYTDGVRKEGFESDTKISATIIVNRPSQRAIVVGSKGSVIKQIGTNARKKIEAMIDGRVHLNLHVKVLPKWFRNNFVLDEIGLPRTQNSHRVWRAK